MFGIQGEVVDVHGIMKDKNIRLAVRPNNMKEQIDESIKSQVSSLYVSVFYLNFIFRKVFFVKFHIIV